MDSVKLPNAPMASVDAIARKTLLIVDDDSVFRLCIGDLLENKIGRENIFILSASSLIEATQLLSQHVVHAMVLDKHLNQDHNDPKHNGVYAIPNFLAIQEHLQIVMSTSSDAIEDVVLAMRNGACSYFVKHSSPELLVETVKKALRDGFFIFKDRAEAERNHPKKSLSLCGNSQAINKLKIRINEVAKADANVLLLGESGAGKTETTILLHETRSNFIKKQNRPFIQLNMAAIPENLAENELFGSESGAFTDSKKLKPGVFEQANGGTLFLDEIAEASLGLQAKLLTVLDRGVFRRMGGTVDIKSQFRLICATNKNLEELIREKKFREDLYHRISVIDIKIPSIIDRKEDIPALMQSIMPKCCLTAKVYVPFEEIPQSFINHLQESPPKGNIRGLEQQLIKLLVFSKKDKRGKPILNDWKSINELNQVQKIELKIKQLKCSVLSDDMELITDSGFDGVTPFLRGIEKKIYIEAKRSVGDEYGCNRKIAKLLKVSDQQVTQKLRTYGLIQSANDEISNFKSEVTV